MAPGLFELAKVFRTTTQGAILGVIAMCHLANINKRYIFQFTIVSYSILHPEYKLQDSILTIIDLDEYSLGHES